MRIVITVIIFFAVILGFGFIADFNVISEQTGNIDYLNSNRSDIKYKVATTNISKKKSSSNTKSNSSSLNNFDYQSSTGFDYMKVLNNINSNSPLQEHYRQLIEAYILASNGEFSDEQEVKDNTLLPENYAAMHKSETNYATFTYPNIHGDPIDDNIFDSTANTYNLSNAIQGSSVWVNNGRDSYPDGPFQFENADGVPAKYKAKDSTLDRWDTYNFKDQLNGITHYTLNANSVLTDKTYTGILAPLVHNRGTVKNQLFGINYGTLRSSALKEENISNEIYTEMFESYFKPFIDATQKYNLQSPHKDYEALGLLIPLREGYYISHVLSPDYILNTLSNIEHIMNRSDATNHYKQLFKGTPQENFTYNEFKEWVRNDRYKSLDEVLDKTVEEIDQIYFTKNGHYNYSEWDNNTYINTFIYKVTDKEGDYYKRGNTEPVIQSFDYVNIRYGMSSIFAKGVFMDLALKAGLPEKIDNKVIDPSNPTQFYKDVDSYSPLIASDSIENAKHIFELLGQKATPIQIEMLAIGMNHYTPYVLGGQGHDVTYSNIKEKERVHTVQRVHSNIKLTTEGDLISSDDQNDSLLYKDKRLSDCSSYASIILNLDNKTYLDGSSTNRATSGWHPAVGKPKEIKHNDKTLSAKILQVNLDGSTSTTFDSSQTFVPGTIGNIANPMDVVVYNNGQAHALVYVGTNRTGQTVTIPPEYTHRPDVPITIGPGQFLFIEQGGRNKIIRVDGLAGYGISSSSSDLVRNDVPPVEKNRKPYVYRMEFNN